MSEPQVYSFQRYLSSKKSVDDRALNRTVFEALVSHLPPGSAPLQILEIGAGIGTMLERLLAWKLHPHLDYTGIDAQPENIFTALERLPAWAAANGYQVSRSPAGKIELIRSDQGTLRNGPIHVQFESADLFKFAKRPESQHQWDLQIAHAFLDLMDIPATLPHLFGLIRPGGLFYYTINFDGVTAFEPAIDPGFDTLLEKLYHQTMDERITNGHSSGDSQAGRHLFSDLQAAGASLLAAGASDWVVHPQAGQYPQDEAYFLHFIVHTLHTALSGRPELDQEQFERWIAMRHNQIERGELIYIAHQLDFAGQIPIDRPAFTNQSK